MSYKPLIVIDDDNEAVRKIFKLKAVKANVEIVDFATWDKTKEYLEANLNIDAIILDAKGQLNPDKDASEAHLLESLGYVKHRVLPYAIYTAYTDELPILEQEMEKGRVFTKGIHKEEDIFEFLKKEIANTPKLKMINKYPEPFQCFGGEYLDKKYENLLVNIVKIFEDDKLTDQKDLLFNPCRILLERVFEKITEVDNKVLPYALLNFDDQRVGLLNCSKYLTGIKVKIKKWDSGQLKIDEYQKDKFLEEHISQQIQTIIGICHPASHDIQKYSQYTFKSVLWAVFDVLIWLKVFVDERR